MFKKGAFTLILAVLIILGLAATSFADPGKGNSAWKFKAKAKVNGVQFNDIGNHWAEQSIKHIGSMGIVSGYPDKKFLPNAPVRRYEALMMICRAADFVPDMDETYAQRLEACLEYAVDQDIIDEDEDFAGWKPAKRYEVAVWAIRASGLEYDGDGLLFNDIDEIPDKALPYVRVMFKHKFMVGYPGNIFQPNKPVTRAEIAAIINRMMDEDYDIGDDSELRLKSLDPADGEDNVDKDIDQLVATFNMDIEAVDDLADVKEGITVRNTDNEDVDVDSVSIDGKRLTIELGEDLEDDNKYRVTIAGDILQSENEEEAFDGIGGSEWEFYTYDTNDEGLSLESLDPINGDDNVDTDTIELRATFDNDISFIDEDLLNAVRVYNVDEEEYVKIDKIEIDSDTLVITLEEELGADDTFKVTIKPGYIEDEDTGSNYGGLGGNNWRFTTAEE